MIIWLKRNGGNFIFLMCFALSWLLINTKVTACRHASECCKGQDFVKLVIFWSLNSNVLSCVSLSSRCWSWQRVFLSTIRRQSLTKTDCLVSQGRNPAVRFSFICLSSVLHFLTIYGGTVWSSINWIWSRTEMKTHSGALTPENTVKVHCQQYCDYIS